MKNTKVTLVPLTNDDREQFILDNQWAFKYGAIEEFGKRDDHLDFDERSSLAKPSSIASTRQIAKPTASLWRGRRSVA